MSYSDQVKKCIAEQNGISVDEVKDDMTLAQAGCDSLDIVELVMAIEDELEVEIPDEITYVDDDLQKSMQQTVADFVRRIDEHMEKQPKAA